MPRESSLTAFCIEQLRLNPDLTLPDLRARAYLEGIAVHPAAFHRAKTSLGLAPTRLRRPRRQHAPDTATAPTAVVALAHERRDDESLDVGIRDALVALYDDRDRLRAALIEIRDLIRPMLEQASPLRQRSTRLRS